jgi:EAL domain-containing protein (putative c-di-GMP-specific phosphodiesterase class I)
MEGGEGMHIIRTIMPLAESLGLSVVAEGVETQDQATILRAMDCRYAQGFYFSEALTVEQASDLLCERSTQSA